jgi:acyl-CoA reductase-like NAD-dependent aldehyde dehydrogenase
MNKIRTLATHYIDGAFLESHGREVMDIVRPTDAHVIGRVTLADGEDTRRVSAANTANTGSKHSLNQWRFSSPERKRS